MLHSDSANQQDRRAFLKAGALATAALAGGASQSLLAANPPRVPAETLVTNLYRSLNERQREAVCFAWDYSHPQRGLLRKFISNNWRITQPAIRSNFFTNDQQDMIQAIFESLVNPNWVQRFHQQFRDDMGGFGRRQSIALFGTPGGEGPFEFVLSGRHGTIRCDGNSADHVCFGGPIVYGHAASGYYERADHRGNVFWPQAQAANRVYRMLDGKQRAAALQPEAPDEARIAFQGRNGRFQGIAVSELSRDQKEHVQGVLQLLLQPYRQSDREEAVAALRRQGGLDRCHLAFYRRDDLGNDQVWDNWRLEGPAFVWHYRGAPHVHVWVHVSDDPSVTLNSRNDSGALRRNNQ